MSQAVIRRFREEDAQATAQVFFDAVHVGARAHYDEAQRRAWAPRVPALAAWRERLRPQSVFVAERDDRIVGFMTLTTDGVIDFAFVAPDVIGQGVAKALYDAVLSEAVGRGLDRLRADASHLARPFFERQGWGVVRRQSVERDGVALTNFVMEKALAKAPRTT